MIVKRKEWDDLVKAKDIIHSEYDGILDESRKEIIELKKRIEELELSLESKELKIRIYNEGKRGDGIYRYKYPYSVEISSGSLDISNGIKTQIRRMFRNGKSVLGTNNLEVVNGFYSPLVS